MHTIFPYVDHYRGGGGGGEMHLQESATKQSFSLCLLNLTNI